MSGVPPMRDRDVVKAIETLDTSTTKLSTITIWLLPVAIFILAGVQVWTIFFPPH